MAAFAGGIFLVGLSLLLIAAAVVSISLAGAPVANAAMTDSAGPRVTNSPGPLLWTAPGGVDGQPIDSIACPSTTLCVAVDRGGDVLWSTDPAGGPSAWELADVDGSNEMTVVSCPSTTLCVAVDGAGNMITSPNPTGGGSSWTVARVDDSKTQSNTDNAGSVLLRGVSCPSTALCVAVDAAGNAVVSTDPTGGATAWTTTHVDTDVSLGCTGTGLTCQPPLVGITCPATTQCVAIDFSGNLLSTMDPTGTAPWTSTPTAGGGLSSLFGISCPVIGFCATADGDAGRAITFNPAAPTAQTSRSLPYSLDGIWCRSRSLCLASVETEGGISGLLGSYDPAAYASRWSLSSLGGGNAVACPSASLCLAGDDEGNISAGVTTKAITTGLTAELLSTRHLPTIAALDRTRRDTFLFTSPIAAQVQLAWTVAGTAGMPVTVASTSHRFATPGRAKLTLRLSVAGRRLFKAATRRLKLGATATFAAGTGSVSAVKTLTFTHPPRPKTP